MKNDEKIKADRQQPNQGRTIWSHLEAPSTLKGRGL
jgi:hypothetical protein